MSKQDEPSIWHLLSRDGPSGVIGLILAMLLLGTLAWFGFL